MKPGYAKRYDAIFAAAFGRAATTPSSDETIGYAPSAAPAVADADDADVIITSPLAGVDDQSWTAFVKAMIAQPLDAVSESNGLGLFAFSPRRLADLGIVAHLARTQSPTGRTIWVAAFVPPLTARVFQTSPRAQYTAFVDSMIDYAQAIDGGEIAKPEDMSLAGALALLHRAGPHGIKTWQTGERFSETQAMYDRVAGVF